MSKDFIPTQALLAWYDSQGRQLPWRLKEITSGEVVDVPRHIDPYKIWISEVLLQQTTVAMAKPYYEKALNRWPTVHHLAAASLDDILVVLQGMGYYRRVHALHACAQAICQQFGGYFPSDPQVLQRLPGIGPYTAAAIAAIAFNVPAVAVDGNIARILSRYWGLSSWGPPLAAELQRRCHPLLPQRVGDYTQALMDLGSLCCTPRRPQCHCCPLSSGCFAFQHSNPLAFPCKPAKPALPQRYGWALWGQRPEGAVWIIRRKNESILKNLFCAPTSPWLELLPESPVKGLDWKVLSLQVQHVFTHFKLHLSVAIGPGEELASLYPEGFWLPLTDIPHYPFPRLFGKIYEAVNKASEDSEELRGLF